MLLMIDLNISLLIKNILESTTDERVIDTNRINRCGCDPAERGSDLAQGSSFPFGAYLGESAYAAGGHPLCHLARPRSKTHKHKQNKR